MMNKKEMSRHNFEKWNNEKKKWLCNSGKERVKDCEHKNSRSSDSTINKSVKSVTLNKNNFNNVFLILMHACVRLQTLFLNVS